MRAIVLCDMPSSHVLFIDKKLMDIFVVKRTPSGGFLHLGMVATSLGDREITHLHSNTKDILIFLNSSIYYCSAVKTCDVNWSFYYVSVRWKKKFNAIFDRVRSFTKIDYRRIPTWAHWFDPLTCVSTYLDSSTSSSKQMVGNFHDTDATYHMMPTVLVSNIKDSVHHPTESLYHSYTIYYHSSSTLKS